MRACSVKLENTSTYTNVREEQISTFFVKDREITAQDMIAAPAPFTSAPFLSIQAYRTTD